MLKFPFEIQIEAQIGIPPVLVSDWNSMLKFSFEIQIEAQIAILTK